MKENKDNFNFTKVYREGGKINCYIEIVTDKQIKIQFEKEYKFYCNLENFIEKPADFKLIDKKQNTTIKHYKNQIVFS